MNEKLKVALLSVISNTLLVIAKLAVGVLSGSISVISEAIHSAMDLVAALIALFAVRASAKPADQMHKYGHGKIENVSATLEALLIFVAALWIIWEAVDKVRFGVTEIEPGLAIAVMAVSAIVNYFVSNQLMKVAKLTDSVALEADAMHLRTDVYTSLGVLVGLVLVKFTGWHIIDSLSAIVVALIIMKAAYRLTKEAFLPLLDTTLPADEEDTIKEILLNYRADFIEFHKLRTRKSGSERHIDLHLVVPKGRSILIAHNLCDNITDNIKKRFPGASVLIHAEPCDDTCDICTDCHHVGE